MRDELFIGLISGTSMDGVDAALLRFGDSDCEILAAICHPYPAPLAAEISAAVGAPAAYGLDRLGRLHIEVARAFAAAADAVIAEAGRSRADIGAIGSHGQTVLHSPAGGAGFSLQVCDPGTLAVLSGITTVADFRNADLAAGGQGAPLAPAFHQWAFGHAVDDRAVLNLGGIANLTLLPPGGPVTGFDTGPANTLLDQWIRACEGRRYDSNGEWAAGGQVNEELLALLLGEPYFDATPPKSTGPELFNLEWLNRQLEGLRGHPPEPRDVQATLAELTAASVADALQRYSPRMASTLAVCGGGVHNRDLLARLARRLPDCRVQSTDDWGIPADWVEAAAFAWMARERLARRANNLPSVTGARLELPLGGVYLPRSEGL